MTTHTITIDQPWLTADDFLITYENPNAPIEYYEYQPKKYKSVPGHLFEIELHVIFNNLIKDRYIPSKHLVSSNHPDWGNHAPPDSETIEEKLTRELGAYSVAFTLIDGQLTLMVHYAKSDEKGLPIIPYSSPPPTSDELKQDMLRTIATVANQAMGPAFKNLKAHVENNYSVKPSKGRCP